MRFTNFTYAKTAIIQAVIDRIGVQDAKFLQGICGGIYAQFQKPPHWLTGFASPAERSEFYDMHRADCIAHLHDMAEDADVNDLHCFVSDAVYFRLAEYKPFDLMLGTDEQQAIFKTGVVLIVLTDIARLIDHKEIILL